MERFIGAISQHELDFPRRVVVIHGPEPVRRVDRLARPTLDLVEARSGIVMIARHVPATSAAKVRPQAPRAGT
jgi:hypothetical protein